MGWKQIIPFDLSKMGTRQNYCLQNVRLAYGIPPKYADAKSAMNASKREGTFHTDGVPKGIAVPLFADTGSPYGHVMVCDKDGSVYSDGKYLGSFKGMTVLGWSETLNDVRIVEYVKDPEPTPPAPEPEPEPEFKVGDKVVPTKLIDYNGTPLVQYDDYYIITQLSGDRAVLSADRDGQMIVWSAMNTANIRKV